MPLFMAMHQDWLVRPVNRIGRVKSRGILVYIRMYRAYVGTLCEHHVPSASRGYNRANVSKQ